MEQKKAKALEWLKRQNTFFHMKELEKMMSKAIGISPMVVSDVIKELRDDDLVEEEKVGASSFYWCFESKLKLKLEQREANLDEEIDNSQREVNSLTKLHDDYVKSGMVATKEVLKETRDSVAALQAKVSKAEDELKQYNELRPEYKVELKTNKTKCVEGVNRWTDNIYNIQGWAKKNFPHINLNKQFNIPDDLDYVE